jgi:hypothetical protein
MGNINRLNICAGLVFFLIFVANCSGATQNSEISFIGQVKWQDIEGGFYGIITFDGTKYLPLNLPESYKVDGVTVDIIGTVPTDVMTIQMWGESIKIKSISPVNENNPFIQPWYTPDGNQSYYENETMAEHLTMASSGLQSGLDMIDNQVSSIAKNLTRDGIEEKKLKSILLQGLEIPGVRQVSFMDKTGKITSIIPEKYDSFEGEDVSGQDFTSGLLSYPVPGMSEYFTMNEGMDAVIVSYPVFSADKKVLGYVEALFDPGNLTEVYALPLMKGTKFDLMVSQPDGKILYDTHPDMNGQEIWNNTIFNKFPDLLSWAAHYQNANGGIDQYSYYRGSSDEIAKTDVIWTTVGLHGTPWRIFILSR